MQHLQNIVILLESISSYHQSIYSHKFDLLPLVFLINYTDEFHIFPDLTTSNIIPSSIQHTFLIFYFYFLIFILSLLILLSLLIFHKYSCSSFDLLPFLNSRNNSLFLSFTSVSFF